MPRRRRRSRATRRPSAFAAVDKREWRHQNAYYGAAIANHGRSVCFEAGGYPKAIRLIKDLQVNVSINYTGTSSGNLASSGFFAWYRVPYSISIASTATNILMDDPQRIWHPTPYVYQSGDRDGGVVLRRTFKFPKIAISEDDRFGLVLANQANSSGIQFQTACTWLEAGHGGVAATMSETDKLALFAEFEEHLRNERSEVGAGDDPDSSSEDSPDA